MVWRQGSSSVVLALALVGCGTFVQAESGTDGEDGSSGTAGTTNTTVSPPTSGGTDSASGGPGTTPVTTNSDTSETNPTDPSDSATSGPTTETGDPPTSSTAGETTDPSDPTDTTGPGEGTEETGEETTGPQPCVQDDAEPNDDPNNAIDMGTQACEAAPNTFMGTLGDVSDLDWFEYYGQWNCGSSNNPNHVLSVTGDVEICWFPLCAFGSEEVQCLSGTSVTSGDGFAGCCSADQIVGDVNCTFTGDESATGVVFVATDDKKLICENYEIEFSVEND